MVCARPQSAHKPRDIISKSLGLLQSPSKSPGSGGSPIVLFHHRPRCYSRTHPLDYSTSAFSGTTIEVLASYLGPLHLKKMRCLTSLLNVISPPVDDWVKPRGLIRQQRELTASVPVRNSGKLLDADGFNYHHPTKGSRHGMSHNMPGAGPFLIVPVTTQHQRLTVRAFFMTWRIDPCIR